MVFKLTQSAEQRWLKRRGVERSPKWSKVFSSKMERAKNSRKSPPDQIAIDNI